jgi:hypothetical protein
MGDEALVRCRAMRALVARDQAEPDASYQRNLRHALAKNVQTLPAAKSRLPR